MPKAQARAQGKEKKKEEEKEKVVYPKIIVEHCYLGAKGPITADQAKVLLGWETEMEFIARIKKADPGIDEESLLYGDNYLLIDENKEKIRCYRNNRNRPYTDAQARRLCQDILDRKWAGPTTYPEETVNCESIIITRTAKVENGQHRLIALILARQLWENGNISFLKKIWKTEPVLETLITYGASDNPVILQTLDNTRPRTLSDTFYTSGLFHDKSNKQRQELSRMLDFAVDLLWKRTEKGSELLTYYQTHSASHTFLDQHKRLHECIDIIFNLNANRCISLMRLSPGQCAGMFYLMGSSATIITDYNQGNPPTEKLISWDNWDKAVKFWFEIARGDAGDLREVRLALIGLEDAEDGKGGRAVEKICILARAWRLYEKADEEITQETLALTYRKDVRGIPRLIDPPDFGGIDKGLTIRDILVEEEETKEEIEQRKSREREKRSTEVMNRLSAKREEGRVKMLDILKKAKENDSETIIFFQKPLETICLDIDAKEVSKITRLPIKPISGVYTLIMKNKSVDSILKTLKEHGKTVKVIPFKTSNKGEETNEE